MKRITFLIVVFVLACLAHDSAAVSPMPIEELKPGQTAIICVIHIEHMPDREKVTPGEVYSKTLFFEVSAPKRDVLAEMTRYIDNRLDSRSVSEFRLECKFPK